MTSDEKDKLQALNTYIDGKIKRYNLIFAADVWTHLKKYSGLQFDATCPSSLNRKSWIQL
jgi:hypothetical protein